MSFRCGKHGWAHLLNPCPSCAAEGSYASNQASSLPPINLTPLQIKNILDQYSFKDFEPTKPVAKKQCDCCYCRSQQKC